MRPFNFPARILMAGLAFGGLLSFVASTAYSKDVKQESWDAVYLAGSKIGHIHIFVEPVSDKKKDYLRVRVDTVLNFRRGKDLVKTELIYGTIETLDGSVLKLDTRTLAAEQELRVHGNVIDNKMKLIIEGGGQSQEKIIDWGPEVRGPYAAEQSLERKPMQAGETRELKMFMPDLNKICDVTLTAKQQEDVQLGDGASHRLLRIDQTTTLDGKPRKEFDVRLWTDSEGQVLKSSMDVMGGMVYYRTTKDGALGPDTGMSVDRIAHSAITVKKRIANSTERRDIRYRVSLPNDDLVEVLPADRRQVVAPEGKDKSTVILEVKTAGPSAGSPNKEEAGPEFLRANALVSSQDSRVKQLAEKATGGATDPWEKACRIAKWVFKNVDNKNFQTTFAPASEVARNLSGDCTEHSVLTAAMCRAVSIPSRVAIGLVYEAESLKGFGYHMWTEVYVNGRWVAIDSTWDQTDVDATHIKLSDSSLDGVAPFEAFLPVARVLGKMSIEPIEVR